MAIDEALLSVPGPPTLRLYGWSREAISLGWFQRPEDFAPLLTRSGDSPTLVRRVTGGAAIHHDDEITLALVLPSSLLPASVAASYRLLHDAVIAALARLSLKVRYPEHPTPARAAPRGPSLCFDTATAHDLVDAEGRKVLGSAQRRSRGRVLHHSSLPLRPARLTLKSGALFRRRDDVEPLLVEEIAAALGLVPHAGALTAEEEAAAARGVASHIPLAAL
jgi:lipoate-protein ligase A